MAKITSIQSFPHEKMEPFNWIHSYIANSTGHTIFATTIIQTHIYHTPIIWPMSKWCSPVLQLYQLVLKITTTHS